MLSSLAIILLRKQKAGCLPLNVLWLSVFTMPWVGMKSVIAAFPGHSHLSFISIIVMSRNYLKKYEKYLFGHTSTIKCEVMMIYKYENILLKGRCLQHLITAAVG